MVNNCLSRSNDAPEWSDILFLRLDPGKVHIFRYLLEAYDNIGYMTVVDRWGGILKISYSPHQEEELLQVLGYIKETVHLEIIHKPE